MNNFTTTKKRVKITDVVPNPWNPNAQSKEMFAKGIQSVKEFGLMGSILVREIAGTYEILDGEHRWKYANELGYTEIDVESLGEIDDSRAKVLTVMLNNLRGKDDIEKRAAIYESLNAGQLQLLPFTSEEIQHEKELFKFNFSQYETTDPGIPENILVHILSFKFTDNEWLILQEALKCASAEGKNEKQWFMSVLQEYLRKNGILSGFTTQ
jgi:hypothetical protein